MSIQEFFLRVLSRMEPLLPFLLVVAGVTVAVLPLLLWLGRGVWVEDRRFRWIGLFFGLRTGDCVRLAGAWIKFILLLTFLAAFRKLELSHYLLFLIPGLVYAVSFREWTRIPGRLFWLALECVGLLSCNLVCGYIKEMNGGAFFQAIYVLMALFAALFGCYLFLTELNDISAGRRGDLGSEEYDDGKTEE